MGRLLALFVLLPALELVLLIGIGRRIGLLATLVLIVATGLVGAALVRRQGLGVLERLRSETRAGNLPADPLIDGAFLVVAGALLVTPGVLTDAFGFALLVPRFRLLLRAALRRRLERAVAEGRLRVHTAGADPFAPPREEKLVRDLRDRPPGAS